MQKSLEHWRKVEDELPKDGQKVIYYFEVTGINIGKYKKDKEGDIFYGRSGFLTNDVTHWMPLPEPPH